MEGDRADRATIAIWELEVWWRAQLEGDRAVTAVCELVVCLVADEGDSYDCYLGTRVWVVGPVGKWATTAIWVLAVFFGGWAGPVRLQCETGFSWRRALENYLSMALSTLLSGQPMYVLVYCAAVSGSEME